MLQVMGGFNFFNKWTINFQFRFEDFVCGKGSKEIRKNNNIEARIQGLAQQKYWEVEGFKSVRKEPECRHWWQEIERSFQCLWEDSFRESDMP